MNQNTMIAIVVLVLVVGGGLWYINKNKADSAMTKTESMVTEDSEDLDNDVDMKKDDTVMEGTKTVTLEAVKTAASPQTGTAMFKEVDGKVQVDIMVAPVLMAAQPAHIHIGTCPGVGDVKYPLTDIVNGKSTTMLDATMADLEGQELALNIHKSAAEVKVYTACGSL